MISTVSHKPAHARPWGTSLAMAGVLVAGLATGRRHKLALVAGIAAVAGIKWMLRRNVTDCARPLEPPTILKIQQSIESPNTKATECCSRLNKDLELDMAAAVHAIMVVPSTENYVADDEVPEVWEQRRDEPVYDGAVRAHTVWFEMPECVEAVPVVPMLAEMNKLPESFFSENPIIGLDPLPMVPAIIEDAATAITAVYPVKASPSAAIALPFFDLQPFSGENTKESDHGLVSPIEVKQIMDELHRGPHRSVVPHAPVDDRRGGRLMALATTVLLVIAAIILVLGVFQPNGWAQGLKRRGQVAEHSESKPPVNDRGDWATPLLREK